MKRALKIIGIVVAIILLVVIALSFLVISSGIAGLADLDGALISDGRQAHTNDSSYAKHLELWTLARAQSLRRRSLQDYLFKVGSL